MTIIEALAIGLPIVFPIGISLGELLTKFGAGEGYNLKDSDSLKKSLERTSDPSRHKKYKEAALQLFREEFSFEGWHEKLLSISASID
jgi:glycosyltransferase involved in cell wall biosynthesis